MSTSATLLDWGNLGVTINSKGARCIVVWDAVQTLELVGD